MLVKGSVSVSETKPYKRIVFYHQTQYKDDRYISLQPTILPSVGVTHVIVAAIHLNTPTRITLNDDLYDADKFIPLWDEVKQLQAAGIKVLGMLGGAAQGSYTKLDGSLEGFHKWYQPLRKMIKWAGFDGLDLDIEEAMSLGGVIRLIDHLKTDFGQSFLVTLAPVAPALRNEQNLGGFNMEELEKGLGSRIAWYNTQFYCGWGDMSEPHDYDRIIARGWPQEKVVIGLVTNPSNCSGYVKEAKLRKCLGELVRKYPRIGGVMGWEYYNARTEESSEPWKWAEMINDILNLLHIQFAKMGSEDDDKKHMENHQHEFSHDNHDDWETQPPYMRPDEATEKRENFEKKVHGSCHCGRVQYWLNSDKPLASKYCHCIDCKKIHGAPFQWAAIFKKTDLAFENGVKNLRFYKTSSGKNEHILPCKVGCAECGSWIMDEGRNMVLLFPTLLNLDTPQLRENFQPQCHIFYTSRVVDIPDGKDKWTKLDKDSELMKDMD
ncbi:hypothetical protein HYE68_007409 [Fusarium pseudograminearum]|nr:hypothetical protein HYE68_007409 [Fusarium pseudograminearum]